MFVMTNQICVVATLWIEEGNVTAFEAYERKAARIMEKYGGSVERVIRISRDDGQLDQPFEVHLVRFPSNEEFAAYRLDPELRALSTERDAAITKTVVLVGYENPAYAT
jgi:uncharacterized protein (DUF1330 family)